MATAGGAQSRSSSRSEAQPAPSVAFQIQQTAGVDSRVDYASLLRFGPWDDRNYRLTKDDVDLLENDASMDLLVPAFYRASIRRSFQQLGQPMTLYPRSSYPRYLVFFGGYLVNGRLYKDAERLQGGGYRILDRASQTPMDFLMERANLVITSESRVTSPNGNAESAIAIRPTDPQYVIAGSNLPGSKQEMHYSEDGGKTWSAAANLPAGGTCCDPTVGWSSDGSKAYTATLGNGVYFYRSSNNGQTWTDLENEPVGAPEGDPRREMGVSFADKEYLHVDTDPSSPYLDTLHLTWHEGGVMQYARSTDFGHTWSPKLSFSSDPSGIGSDITTDSSGNVYYLYPNSNPAVFSPSDIRLLKSTDGGASFAASTVVGITEVRYEFKIPIMDTRKTWVHISADSDRTGGPHQGNVYATWTDSTGTTTSSATDNHARIRVAVSNDAGASWTLTTPHETADQNTVDRFHPWLGVDGNGNVHVIFYDTRQDLPGRLAADLYHSVSTDGALTWSAPDRLTSASSPEISSSFEWGDYNGMDVVGNQLLAIYTDNRAEAAEIGDSRDVYAISLVVDALFLDGFESGDTSLWSQTLP